MDYERLISSEAKKERAHSRDSESDTGDKLDQNITDRASRSLSKMLCPLLVLIQTCTITLIMAYILFGKQPTCSSPWTNSRVFLQDTRYMTLDHHYDQLWNETDVSSLIWSAEGISNGSEKVGGIAM